MSNGSTSIRVNGPRVSVVIPTHNRERWISRAIDSVLGQTYTDLEIIVVDDGSTDQSRQAIGTYGDRVRYIYQANAGVSAARNRGIKEARGEWVALLDSDDEWLPEKLEAQLDLADRYPQLVMVASDVHIEDGINRLRLFDIRERLFENNTEQVIYSPLLVVAKINFFPSSLLIKRSALSQAGMFDEELTYGEDRDLACRVAILGPLGVLVKPLATIFSRGGGDVSLSGAQDGDRRNAHRSTIVTCEKLLASRGLTPSERSFVERCLDAACFYFGMEEFRRGNKGAGLSLMWRSCKEHQSIRSIVRVLLFFVVGYSGIMFFQKLKSRKGYRRSDHRGIKVR
jgi:hypothetical protein